MNIHVVIAMLVKKLPEAFELTNPTEEKKKYHHGSMWVSTQMKINMSDSRCRCNTQLDHTFPPLLSFYQSIYLNVNVRPLVSFFCFRTPLGAFKDLA